jgi:tetratricopeptide (TPR) repeat protein
MKAVGNASRPLPDSVHSSLRAGVDPLDNLHVMENHDQAWHIWREAGVKRRVLVHVDAHHDMWWIDDNRYITIANFICPALKEDVVREMYWIVPDGTLKSPVGRSSILKQVKSVVKGYKGDLRRIEVTPTSITVPVIGKKLSVSTMDSLAPIGEPVLLDIDVDYLVIPRVAHNHADRHADRPWCWPAELLDKIRSVHLRADLVTIAYSVEGCYTPLRWKYLGDELAARLRRPGDDHALAGFRLLRTAIDSFRRGNFDDAETACCEAATLLPQSAAPHYHLALLDAERGRAEEAQRHSRKARELDPTYATGFNNLGPCYFWQKHDSQAEAEFQRALTLDPTDSHACTGMAWLAARRGHWNQSITWFRRALDSSDDVLDAHRGLGQAYARTGDLDSAVKHYERSLQLALHGHKPLSWHILTVSRPDQLLDEDHCASYAELGRIHARRGEIQKAIACYQIAVAANAVGVRLRLQLARLFAMEKRWRESQLQLALACRRVPNSVRFHARRAWWGLGQARRNWTEKLSDERARRTLES